LKKHYIIR